MTLSALAEISTILGRGHLQEFPLLLDALRRWGDLSAAHRRAAILHHLQHYLADVAESCPYYQHSWQTQLGTSLSWESFQQLPCIDRRAIQEHGAKMRRSEPKAPWLPKGTTSTSGSTGAPIITESTLPRGMMQGAIAQLWHTREARDLDLDTAFITEPHAAEKAFPREGRALGKWGARSAKGEGWSYTLSAPPEDQLDWLLGRNPGYLVTYPSNLQSLLLAALERGEHPARLREVMLSSEPIPPALCEQVANLWGARVSGTYSSSELGIIALQRADGLYHVEDATVLVEVLDDAGQPVPQDGVGRIVVTTLQERLRPLIRYAIGDYARVHYGDDGELRLSAVMGRERTMVIHKAGHPVWPYFELGALTASGKLAQWQLIQHADLSLTVRVVAHGDLDDAEEKLIRTAIEQSTGSHPIRIVPVKSIARTARGKFQEVISEVEQR